jgi:hypothetical protein
MTAKGMVLGVLALLLLGAVRMSGAGTAAPAEAIAVFGVT